MLTFLAAATNEVTGGMLLILYFLHWLRYERKFKIRYALLIVFAGVAMLTVILAPGNTYRAENITHTQEFSFGTTVGIARQYLELLVNVHGKWYVLSLSIIAFLIQCTKKEKPLKKYEFYDFVATGLAGLAALSLSETYIDRAAFSPFMYLLVAFISSLVYVFRYVKAYDKNYITVTISFLKKLLLVELVYRVMRAISSVIHSVVREEIVIAVVELILIVLLMVFIYFLLIKFSPDKVFVIKLKSLPDFIKGHFGKITAVATAVCLVFLTVNAYIYSAYEGKEMKRSLKAIENYSEYRTDKNKVTYPMNENTDSVFTADGVGKFNYPFVIFWLEVYYDVNYKVNDGNVTLTLSHNYVREDKNKKFIS